MDQLWIRPILLASLELLCQPFNPTAYLMPVTVNQLPGANVALMGTFIFLGHSFKEKMQLLITPPLNVQTAMAGILEMMPVRVDISKPSKVPELWLRFLKTGGRRIPLSPVEASRCQQYMQQHNTEAISEDGITAFTVAGNSLIECLPEVCMNTSDIDA
jgi:hypothetical protein